MMQHNLSIYDTGRENSYARRNGGWGFASIMLGGAGQAFLVPFFVASIIDPVSGTGLLLPILFGFLEFLVLVNLVMFGTHRNFALSEAGTDANDAIWSLPAAERKRWKVSKAELNALTTREANLLVDAVNQYKSNNPSAAGKVARLTQALNDINNEYKMIEGRR